MESRLGPCQFESQRWRQKKERKEDRKKGKTVWRARGFNTVNNRSKIPFTAKTGGTDSVGLFPFAKKFKGKCQRSRQRDPAKRKNRKEKTRHNIKLTRQTAESVTDTKINALINSNWNCWTPIRRNRGAQHRKEGHETSRFIFVKLSLRFRYRRFENVMFSLRFRYRRFEIVTNLRAFHFCYVFVTFSLPAFHFCYVFVTFSLPTPSANARKFYACTKLSSVSRRLSRKKWRPAFRSRY